MKSRKPILLRVKEDIHDKIKEKADEIGISVNAYINMLLSNDVKQAS